MAVLLGIIWTGMQAAEIAGATMLSETLAALRPVILHTRFGHLVLLRGLLLLTACGGLAVRQPRPVILLPLTGAALAIQGFLGHAGAVGGGTGATLLASETLHLLAAGAWLGGLLPLFLLISELPPGPATAACHAFSLVGAVAVALIAATALEQSSQWFGGLGPLFGTRYGRIALLKLTLFLLLLALASGQSLRPHRTPSRPRGGPCAPFAALVHRDRNDIGFAGRPGRRLSRLDNAGHP